MKIRKQNMFFTHDVVKCVVSLIFYDFFFLLVNICRDKGIDQNFLGNNKQITKYDIFIL